MKKTKKRKQFLEELMKTPNVSYCCDKIGISRQSLYRWKKEDPDFSTAMDEAIEVGIESVNDLAESKLMQKIQMGEFPAIKFWLESNKKKYVKPRPKDFWDKIIPEKEIKEIKITVVETPNGKKQEIGYPQKPLT